MIVHYFTMPSRPRPSRMVLTPGARTRLRAIRLKRSGVITQFADRFGSVHTVNAVVAQKAGWHQLTPSQSHNLRVTAAESRRKFIRGTTLLSAKKRR